MYKLLLVTLFIPGGALWAQNCDCSSELAYAVNYFEENNPAFQKIKSDAGALDDYRRQVARIEQEASLEKDPDRCIIHLDRYVKLLKDHHSGIGFNLRREVDMSTPEAIQRFKNSETFQRFEKIELDTAAMMKDLRQRKQTDVEGVYSNSGSLVFAIVRTPGSETKYQGIIVRKNSLLDVGHLLLELDRQPDKSFDLTYHTGLLGFTMKKIFRNTTIENGQMPEFGFAKVTTELPQGKTYEFRALNDSTNYLRLSSFSGPETRELDSFYAAIADKIKNTPYLVVDVRNNGGGNEQYYFDLLPYAYTKPLVIDPAFVWVSPENIKRYKESGANDNIELVERMKAAKSFSFIPQQEGGDNTWALDSVSVFPKKIALLFNRGTASAAEGMIVYFMQSDKVITVGENSGGYIGYGNVMRAQTPCGRYTLNSTTTSYKEKSKYEFVGIPPAYPAAGQADWVKYAVELLRQSN